MDDHELEMVLELVLVDLDADLELVLVEDRAPKLAETLAKLRTPYAQTRPRSLRD